MQPHDPNHRLSQITTLWSMVLQANPGPEQAVPAAQEELMRRYGGAVYRYLLRVVRDPDVADDLAQEFALRFLRGDFRRADPQHGRFRNFVKTAVLNLVADHHRRRKVRPGPLPEDVEPATPQPESPDLDRDFVESWRTELLTRAWEALEEMETQTGQPVHTVLRFRADHPDLNSSALAERLGGRLGRAVTGNWVRQVLFRARQKFTDVLLDDVAQSLPSADAQQLEDELSALGLLDYLKKRGRKPFSP